MIENYQTRILKPDEVVDYASELMNGIRPETIQMEPLVGFKVLCKDLNAYTTSQANRFQLIEQNLFFLKDSGCVIRETHMSEAPDGFWVITFPVPLMLLSRQLTNLMNVLTFMGNQFGIVATDVCEINISGRCGMAETEARLARIQLPQYAEYLVEPTNTPYKMGHVVRINEDFIMLRTMWDWARSQSNGNITKRFNELLTIPQLVAVAFH